MPITDFDGALSALESRADIASLEGLHAQRRQLLPEYAALRALHGANGKWDNKRKAFLEALKVKHRIEAGKRGEKTTDAYVDALAHGDDGYIAFVDQGIAGAVRYVELDVQISEIEEQIRNREICLLSFNAELRLAR